MPTYLTILKKSAQHKLAIFLIAIAILVVSLVIHDRYILAINASSSLDGNLFLIDRLGAKNTHSVNDIIAFNFDGSQWGFPKEVLWAKRVAGLPGDKIEVKGQEVWVADNKVVEIVPAVMKRGSLSVVRVKFVPQGKYFVVGDNDKSFDSRYAEFGFVSTANIVGEAFIFL